MAGARWRWGSRLSTRADLGQLDFEWDESTRTLKVYVEKKLILELTRSQLTVNGTLNGAKVDADDLEFSSEARGDIIRREASNWNRVACKTAGMIPVGDGTDVVPVVPTGDVTINGSGVTTIGAAKVTNAMLAKPRLRCVTETLTAASLTDGGAAVGTKTLTAAIPAGARFLFATCSALTGFAGDTSAVITLGDGTDGDRYNTGTPDIFTTAAAGVDLGEPSGTAFHATAKTVVATVTSAADITPVLAGGGSVDLQLWFLEPI